MAMNVGYEVIGKGAKINKKGWEKAWTDFMSDAGDKTKDYFEQSFRGFHRHSPTATKRGPTSSGGDIEVVAGVLQSSASNDIYSYVNWGTGSRLIVPRVASRLRFRAQYLPATRRGSLSGGKWKKTGPWRVELSVIHTGIKARRFDEFIQMLMREWMKREGSKVQRTMRGKTWRKT